MLKASSKNTFLSYIPLQLPVACFHFTSPPLSATICCFSMNHVHHCFIFTPPLFGVRCSSMVRAFADGVMGCQTNPSWWTHWAISHSSQCPMIGVTKTSGMCYPVSGMMHIKEPLLLIEKSSLCGGSRFPLSLSEWLFTMSVKLQWLVERMIRDWWWIRWVLCS